MAINAKLKAMIDKRAPFIRFATWLYTRVNFTNKFRVGRRNKLKFSFALLRKTKIIAKGTQNVITIMPGARMSECRIYIKGNNNRVTIGKYCSLKNTEIWIEDDGGEVTLGEYTSVAGETRIACIEGRKIEIGNDCMFSANISIRTGDSHSVLDLDGNRINPSKDVKIGNRVWVGNTVLMTKGIKISDNSIVGTGSVVTKRFDESNVAIGGNPAKIIKTHISWDRKRIPI